MVLDLWFYWNLSVKRLRERCDFIDLCDEPVDGHIIAELNVRSHVPRSSEEISEINGSFDM